MLFLRSRTLLAVLFVFQGELIVAGQKDQRFYESEHNAVREADRPHCGDICCECGSWALFASACFLICTSNPIGWLTDTSPVNNSLSNPSSIKKPFEAVFMDDKKFDEQRNHKRAFDKKVCNFTKKRQ